MTETNYSVAHLWAQGDSVNRSVAVLLLLMSLASWSVMLIKAWTLWRMRHQVESAQAFWHATSYEQGVQLLAQCVVFGRRAAVVHAQLQHRDVGLGEHGFEDGPTAVVQAPHVGIHTQLAPIGG